LEAASRSTAQQLCGGRRPPSGLSDRRRQTAAAARALQAVRWPASIPWSKSSSDAGTCLPPRRGRVHRGSKSRDQLRNGWSPGRSLNLPARWAASGPGRGGGDGGQVGTPLERLREATGIGQGRASGGRGALLADRLSLPGSACMAARADQRAGGSSRPLAGCASAAKEARFVGEHDCLDAVPEAQLLEDVGDVRLDRRVADVELLADLRVGEAPRD